MGKGITMKIKIRNNFKFRRDKEMKSSWKVQEVYLWNKILNSKSKFKHYMLYEYINTLSLIQKK